MYEIIDYDQNIVHVELSQVSDVINASVGGTLKSCRVSCPEWGGGYIMQYGVTPNMTTVLGGGLEDMKKLPGDALLIYSFLNSKL